MLAIHDRMPVVIPPESFAVWLDPEIHDPGKLARLLRPFHPDEMTAYPVSTLVNSVRNDLATCIEPVEIPAPEKQTRLFSPESST
jgi:putative SOS response-associated peptidase YedK